MFQADTGLAGSAIGSSASRPRSRVERLGTASSPRSGRLGSADQVDAVGARPRRPRPGRPRRRRSRRRAVEHAVDARRRLAGPGAAARRPTSRAGRVVHARPAPRPACRPGPRPAGSISSSTSALIRSTRSAISSRSSLSVEAGGLGAVLVGVAEHADRVEPGRGQEPLQLGEVGLGLAREADDHVAARAGVGRERADPGQQVEERLGRRRSASSGAAPSRWRAGRTGRSTARRPAWWRSPRAGPGAARPAAGRRPGPGRCRRPRPARAAASRARAGRRDPCRRTSSSR